MQSSIQEIIIRERFEELDQQDLLTLKAWRDSSKSNELQYQNQLKIYDDYLLAEKYNAIDVDAAWNRVDSHIEIKTRPIKKNRNWFTIAAMILLTLSFGIYFYLDKTNTINNTELAANDLPPGGNRAILTLADGSTIKLSDDQNGIIIEADSISYTDGTSLFVDGTSSPFVIGSDSVGSLSTQQPSTLTLTTPKGGQYQVTLPDGTKVWLNAASKLSYPSHFTGKDRRVELTGEAYFEVAKNTKQAFIVTSAGQEVTVLGTHFNINAYKEEGITKTTVLEGSVSVSNTVSSRGTRDLYTSSSSTILKPNQQSIFDGKTITTQTIDPTGAIAWKNNLFLFEKTDLKSILLSISRWYDIEVDLTNVPNNQFNGRISRSVTLAQVLNMMEKSSDLKFTIETIPGKPEGRRLIVTK